MEYCQRPFTDKEENAVNTVFRIVAIGILTFALLIEVSTDGDEDSSNDAKMQVYDILILALVVVALLVFVMAIHPARLYEIYRRYVAIGAFRNVELDAKTSGGASTGGGDEQGLTLGELGQRKHRGFALAIATKTGVPETAARRHISSALVEALTAVPKDIPKAAIITGGFSYLQIYQLLMLVDRDEDLDDLVIFYCLLLNVTPLMTVAGAHMGGQIPVSIGALINVRRLVLSDMKFLNDCGLGNLAELPHLEFLNIDSNNFTETPTGLGRLTQLRSLSMANLALWGKSLPQEPQQQRQQQRQRTSTTTTTARYGASGSSTGQFDVIKDNARLLHGLARELQKMRRLKHLEFTFDPLAAVPLAIAEALWNLDSFLAGDGVTLVQPAVETVAALEAAAASSPQSSQAAAHVGNVGSLLVATHFKAEQFKAGGMTAGALKRGGFKATDCRDAGFSAPDCRGAGFTSEECSDAGFTPAQRRTAGWRA